MRKEIIVPGLAVVSGIAGFFLRGWELSAAFEPDTGLPIPFEAASICLVVFSLVMAAAFALLCRGKHSVFPGGYDQAFGAKGNTVYITTMVLSAFLILAAALLTMAEAGGTLAAQYRADGKLTAAILLPALPKLLLALLCVASCGCVLKAGKNNYRGEGRGKYAFALLMPAYTACLWLIVAYQQRAGDPIRLDYIYELFAIIAALLGLYFTASFSFERAKVFRAAFFSALGVFFSVTTLADAHDLATTLLYGFMVLYLTANLTALLFNDRLYRDALPADPPAGVQADSDTNDIITEVTPDEQ